MKGNSELDILNIVLGNLCTLLAMGTDSISATQKTTTRVLWVQNLSQLFYCASAIFLKGYSAAVQNVISIIRNMVAIKKIDSKAVQWFLVILGTILGLWFNNLGWMGLVPVIANLQYTLVIFHFQNNDKVLKISFLTSALMFTFFSLFIYNFVGVITNFVVAVTTAISLFKR